MKIKINKDALVNGFQLVHGVVGLRTTLPILSNVLLQAKQGRLWMTTTDLDVSIRCGIEAEIDKEGVTTLPARRLLSIARELPADTVTITVNDKNVAEVNCGSSMYKINGLAYDEFPPLPELSGGNSYTIDRLVFKDMVQKTIYAASTDETRFILNGNLLSFTNGKLIMVATDGRRLALSEQEVDFPKEAEADLVIPTKALNELLKIVGGEGPMKIHAVKNQVAFEVGDNMLVTKLIEGQYPNFRQVIPSHSEQRIAVEREMLFAAIRRVSLLISDKSYSVKLKFGRNKLLITASAPDVGEAEETLPIKYSGKEIEIAFNPDFIMDPLKNIVNDEVYLEITDDMSPAVVKCDGAFLYVLMPMRVN